MIRKKNIINKLPNLKNNYEKYLSPKTIKRRDKFSERCLSLSMIEILCFDKIV